jgi:hypothetical protein
MSDRIRPLTEIARRWRARLTWRVPFERAGAEGAIAAAYAAAGLAPPSRVVWAGGPLEAQRMLARITRNPTSLILPLALAAATVVVEQGGVIAGLWPAGNAGLAVTLALLLTLLTVITSRALGGVIAGYTRIASADDRILRLQAACLFAAVAAVTVFLAVRDGDRPASGGLIFGFVIAAVLAPEIIAHLRRPDHFRNAGPSRTPTLTATLDGALTGLHRRSANNALAAMLDEHGRLFQDVLRSVLPQGFWAITPTRWSVSRLAGLSAPAGGSAGAAAAAFARLAFEVDALWPFERLALALKPPVSCLRDNADRFHLAGGPAISWADGTDIHALHGRVFTGRDRLVFTDPEQFTLAQIRREPNADLRRLLIDRYGPARIMRNRGARKIAQDGFGSLWRFENFDGEPLVMVCVRNSTPEPDGTFKDYWLRVPPHVVSPRQAVAWTFDMTPHQYQPSAQT